MIYPTSAVIAFYSISRPTAIRRHARPIQDTAIITADVQYQFRHLIHTAARWFHGRAHKHRIVSILIHALRESCGDICAFHATGQDGIAANAALGVEGSGILREAEQGVLRCCVRYACTWTTSTIDYVESLPNMGFTCNESFEAGSTGHIEYHAFASLQRVDESPAH